MDYGLRQRLLLRARIPHGSCVRLLELRPVCLGSSSVPNVSLNDLVFPPRRRGRSENDAASVLARESSRAPIDVPEYLYDLPSHSGLLLFDGQGPRSCKSAKVVGLEFFQTILEFQ